MSAYAKCLPPGVMNFVSGQGRVTMSPVMKTGVDIFAFIGGSKAADTLIREHPAPHRLKVRKLLCSTVFVIHCIPGC